jgi:PAS domain S-box-containing protein
MAAPPSAIPKDAPDLSGLIGQLQEIDQRLRALTGGEIDAVISPGGQSFLLKHAQAQLLTSFTEQRALAEALEAEQERLREAQAVARIGSWSLDVRSRALTWSAEMHRIYGTDPALPPDSDIVLERTHPDDLSRVQETFRSTLANRVPACLQARVLLPDGTVKFTEQRWQVECSGDGEVIRAYGTCQDITERARAEQTLRDSQAQLRMATRLGRIGAWYADTAARTIVWSDEICALLEVPPGYAPSFEEAIKVYHPTCRETILKASLACEAEGTPFDLELEIVTARGRTIVVRTLAEAVRDGSGRVTRIHGALQDLSERKAAEDTSRRLAAQLERTLEGLTLGFLSVDTTWQVTYCNAAAERLFNVRREDLLHASLWECLSELSGTAFEPAFRRVLDEQSSELIEARVGATPRWLRATADPIEGGVAIYLRDVTAEREADRRLRLLHSGVARISDCLVIFEATPIDGPTPRIVFANDAFERVTGYALSEVLLRSPSFLYGPETDRAEVERVDRSLARGEPVRAELVNYTKAGEPFWTEIEVVPVAEEGAEISHFVAIMRDITATKRDQAAMRQLNSELERRVSERTRELRHATVLAEEANRAKSTFLATMSHEIRTPMNGVIGLIDVLAQNVLSPSQSEVVEILRESADSLLQIIDDILNFSKIEAGKLELESTPISMEEKIERVCGLLQSMAQSRGVELRYFVDPRIPEPLMGDALRVRQVLTNLVNNAIKFSAGRGASGRVSVRAELAGPAPEDVTDGATLRLTVADNGIGMNPDTLSRLFRPFSQADQSTTRRFGGTGLGLAITHELVRRMGGTIQVSSEPGVGSVFTVHLRLPLAPGAAVPSSQDPRVRGLHCELVGGTRDVADDLSAYLIAGGATVEVIADGSSLGAADRPSGSVVTVALPHRNPLPGSDSPKPRLVLLDSGERVAVQTTDTEVERSWVGLGRNALFQSLAFLAGRVREPEPPVRRDHLLEPYPSSSELRPLAGDRILVAEDLDTNRAVIEHQLGVLGLKADFAVDGREALERWREQPYTLVLTDLRMPELDGYTLATTIRAEEKPGSRTAIIALTANGLPEEQARCRAAGMDDYLVKPVRLPRLKAVLERWLSSARADAPVPAKPPPIPVSERGPVDLRVLESLLGTDAAAMNAVLQKFRTNTERLGGALLEAARRGRVRDAVAPAHTLKSGARAVGAIRLGALCETLEEAAEAGRAPVLNALAGDFEAELESVRRFLDARS